MNAKLIHGLLIEMYNKHSINIVVGETIDLTTVHICIDFKCAISLKYDPSDDLMTRSINPKTEKAFTKIDNLNDVLSICE